MATRTCPRCKTDNDVARANCQNCGGVMLGVGGPMGGADRGHTWTSTLPDKSTSVASPSTSAPPVDSDLERMIQQKLDKARNLTPEKRAEIEAKVRRLAQRMGTSAESSGAAAAVPASGQGGCAKSLIGMAVAWVFFGAVSVSLFSGGSSSLKQLLGVLTKADEPPAVAPTPATEVPVPLPVPATVPVEEQEPKAAEPEVTPAVEPAVEPQLAPKPNVKAKSTPKPLKRRAL